MSSLGPNNCCRSKPILLNPWHPWSEACLCDWYTRGWIALAPTCSLLWLGLYCNIDVTKWHGCVIRCQIHKMCGKSRKHVKHTVYILGVVCTKIRSLNRRKWQYEMTEFFLCYSSVLLQCSHLQAGNGGFLHVRTVHVHPLPLSFWRMKYYECR